MNKTFIIGEAGSNHNGDFLTAIKLIDIAKDSGCDAVKFQLFTSSELYAKCTPDFAGYKNINKLMRKLELPKFWIHKLMMYCTDIGIEFMVTPFDKVSVDYIDTLGVEKFKISGFESTDLDFVDYVLSKRKPTIITVGIGYNINTMSNIINLIKENNYTQDITLLYCNHSYPTPFEDLGLDTINVMKEKYGEIVNVGFSDHTKGILAPSIAVAKGASVIEKHFTINRNHSGPDHNFSLDPQELKEMVSNIRNVELMSGVKDVMITKSEEKIKMAMRGIYPLRNITQGEVFSEENVITKRPLLEGALQASELRNLYGKIANKNLDEDVAIRTEDIK